MKLHKFLLFFVIFLFYALWLNAPGSHSEEAPNGYETGGPSELESIERSIMAAPESSNGEIQTVKTLDLSECIEIAMRNYLPLRTAKKNLKLAGWRLWEARRNLLPKVGIKWDEYTGKIYGRRFYGKKQSVDIQQTLFHGGEFVFTMKQAETNLKIVNREYARIKNDLMLQVKKGYYALAKAKENFKLQQELSREVSRIHEMVIKEFESGVTPNLELLNVNSQANQVRFQLVSARGDVEVAELILKQVMNIDARERIDIEPMPEFRKVEVNFENILADALIHRPEMQISSLMVQYYMYEGKIARSKGWPKIDFMGSFGLAKEEYISKDQNTNPVDGAVDADQKLEQQWYAGVKCSIPIWGSTGEYSYTKEHWVPVVSAYHGTETITNSLKFNFLDNLAQYSDRYAADVDIGKARQEFIKTKQDVTLEVKESCFNYEKALMQLDTALNKVKYQESDLQFIKLKRQMDEIQDSNVIESMIKLAQEKFGYVQAISDCNTALAAISKAVGTEDYFKDNNKK